MSRNRPTGYATWHPRRESLPLLNAIHETLSDYRAVGPITLRQLFYVLVGREEIEKTERAYKRLGDFVSRARRASLISFDDIRDDGVTSAESLRFAGPEDFREDVLERAAYYRRDRQAGQPVRVEVICEAAGMVAQLHRVCAPWSVDVFSGGGFMSVTSIRDVALRAADRSVPTVVLHLGDFDPSGVSVFDRVREDVWAFAYAEGAEFDAVRVALTEEQVADYGVATAPPKPSDSRSKTWSGETAQLEALPPDVIADILDAAIRRYLDDTIRQGVISEEAEERKRITEVLEAVML